MTPLQPRTDPVHSSCHDLIRDPAIIMLLNSASFLSKATTACQIVFLYARIVLSIVT